MLSELASLHIRCYLSAIPSDLMKSTAVDESLSSMNQQFCSRENQLLQNILNFGYGINYKYEGMLAHSFDRFYVVTKLILPSIGDLNFSKLNYDNTYTYLDNTNICNADTKKYILDLITFCKKIEPFVIYYRRLIKSYNNKVHNILKNEIDLILPQTQGNKNMELLLH